MSKLWNWLKEHIKEFAAGVVFVLLVVVLFLTNNKKGLRALRKKRADRLEGRLEDIEGRTEERDKWVDGLVEDVRLQDEALRDDAVRVEAQADALADVRAETAQEHEERLRRIEEARGFGDVRFRR